MGSWESELYEVGAPFLPPFAQQCMQYRRPESSVSRSMRVGVRVVGVTSRVIFVGRGACFRCVFRESQVDFERLLVEPILRHLASVPEAAVLFHCVSGHIRGPVTHGWGSRASVLVVGGGGGGNHTSRTHRNADNRSTWSFCATREALRFALARVAWAVVVGSMCVHMDVLMFGYLVLGLLRTGVLVHRCPHVVHPFLR